MNLQSSTALVTGGAVRIGRAICQVLSASGCGVVVHYNRSRTEAEKLVDGLQRAGRRAFAVKGTLFSQENCERVIDQAWEKAGRIDVLVNNAAVFHKDTLMSATEEKVMEELKVNFLAPMMLTRAFALRACGADNGPGIKGKVVNLLDRRIAGNETDCVSYLLSKKMLAEFTRNAALELAPSITVNGVAPGAILPPSGRGADRVRDLAGKVPLQRQCTPDEVAAAVAFLLESDAITGQTVFVDGGQHLVGTWDIG